MVKSILVGLLCMVSVQALAAPSASGLFSAIAQRLSYMEDVGLYKANHNLPIEDIAREEVVISKASESAAEVGLDSQSIEGFFRAQISAAKAIQYRYRADLLNTPTNREPRDLKTVVRPALITLGEQINQEVLAYLNAGGQLSEKDWNAFSQTLELKYLSEADKRALFDALSAIRLK
ncbi:chorismate mutase [Photobacterium rosenbergii]|uniref:chorismate mutase n=1 Tax=Photobacterium rosenbergii TaxID=294936 RepID=A0A2T3NFN3_9GAMM|nr:chorismate mutase [Photobacterium rosenbergii]PSW13383.1 chorismate mutase [Photobacterium rosenbergii]